MIEETVILLGHSAGGFITLEAALRTKNLSKLILNEPTLIPKEDENLKAALEEVADKLESILREKGNEEALVFFLENLQKISSHEEFLRLDYHLYRFMRIIFN